jgi:hypothetical protein
MALYEDSNLTSSTGTIRKALLDPLQFLDERETIYAQMIVAGMKPPGAARAAGYKQPEKLGYRVLKRTHVAKAVQFLAEENRKAAQMTREKVMNGFSEAIDMARMQGDAGNMVAGWREIGRMCGLYEPERKQVDVNLNAKRVISKLETMSTDELFDFIEGESEEVVEAEFEALPDPQFKPVSK